MVTATLVNVDIERGAEVLKILDDSQLQIRVALWLFSPDHENWFLVLASRQLDGSRDAYIVVNDALRKAGFAIERKPFIMILRMDDPLIKDLRRQFAKAKNVEGMRLRQTIGDWFIEDAYVYRIS